MAQKESSLLVAVKTFIKAHGSEGLKNASAEVHQRLEWSATTTSAFVTAVQTAKANSFDFNGVKVTPWVATQVARVIDPMPSLPEGFKLSFDKGFSDRAVVVTPYVPSAKEVAKERAKDPKPKGESADKSEAELIAEALIAQNRAKV